MYTEFCDISRGASLCEFVVFRFECLWYFSPSSKWFSKMQTFTRNMWFVISDILRIELIMFGLLSMSCFNDVSCVAACCGVLQCDAVWCSVVQCVAVCCSVLQCVAVCCSVLQCVAVCCSVLQCAAVHSQCYIIGVLWMTSHHVLQCVAVCCSVLQGVAVCCSMLQRVAVCCSVLQRSVLIDFVMFIRHRITEIRDKTCHETHCNTLQHTATHCNTLQHTATTLQHAAAL